MKLGDFNIFKSYFEKNPEATEAPDSMLEEEKKEESKLVTINDLLDEIQILKQTIVNNKSLEVPKQDETTKSEIEELRTSIKELTTEMQQANAANADMPKEETSDDILKSFFTGGN